MSEVNTCKPSARLKKVYDQMIRRCYNANCSSYYLYGERGIKVCDEWLSDSKSFFDWAYRAGYKDDAPQGECTLERKNVNGNYSP